MAGPRPTAIHFTLIFCVMLALGLGTATYVLHKETKRKEAALETANARNRDFGRDFDNRFSQIDDIKARLGYTFNDVGATPDGVPPGNTVIAALLADLRDQEGTLYASNAADALRFLRAEITRLEQIRDTQVSDLSRVQQRLLDVRTAIGNRTARLTASRQDSAARLQRLIAEHDALIRQKDAMITQLRSETQREQVEKEAVRDELDRVRIEINSQVSDREQRIENLNIELEQMRQVSFERADGYIISVDNNSRVVYINLGSADLLKEQLTFSVYIQNHHGIGRGTHEVKGAIQVTRILGPHQALAEILYEDHSRPIAPGDPIFTPIWRTGISEQFAFVGIIDVDGDKQGDWDYLREILEHAGSRMQLYVDDNGNLQPPGAELSVQTKYLIVGTILDQTDFPGDVEMQNIATRIQGYHNDLTGETLRYGIRILTLNEFLIYIGYRPQERHWVPGTQRRFNFTQGATPPPTSREILGQDPARNLMEGVGTDRSSRSYRQP